MSGQQPPPTACSPADPLLQAQVEGFYRGLAAGMSVSGLSVGVVRAPASPGEPIAVTRCLSGYADVAEERPIVEDTVFEIGSTTKTFTTTMLAAAVSDGRMDLAATVQSRYDDAGASVRVPVYVDPATADPFPMTMVDLANYTSGIPDKSPTNLKGPNEYSLPMMHEYLAGLILPVKPGTQYRYVNTNFAMIAELLMLMEGFSEYDEALQALIARAGLAMGSTGVIESNTPAVPNLAQGYRLNGDIQTNYAMRSWPALQGAGGIYSTLDDMLQWLQFNMALTESPLNGLLPMLQKVSFSRGPSKGQGLGWFVSLLQGTDLVLIDKNGDTGAFHSWIGFLPEAGVGTVLLCNTSMSAWPEGAGPSPVDALGPAILKAVCSAS